MKSDWFKNKTKYVVSRRFNGDRHVIIHSDGEIAIRPSIDDESIDTDLIRRQIRACSDDDFVVTGYVCHDTWPIIYVTDISYHNGDVRDEPWHERYMRLRKEFDWNDYIRLSRPIVVTNRDEMQTSFEIMDMLPTSDGAIVFDYEGTYPLDKREVPPNHI